MAAPKTHYDTLGVGRSASADQIKTAYRKLVLKHHPDRSSDPASAGKFIQITEAYEVLSDASARRSYDDYLADRARRVAEQQAAQKRKAQQAAPAPPPPKPKAEPRVSVAADVARVSAMFSRGQFADAEKLAQKILEIDPKQPVPYAVLGDLARSRGKVADAAKMYSYALQMDPRNALYLRRYEDLLQRSKMTETGAKHSVTLQAEDRGSFAIIALVVMVVIEAIYVMVSPEKSAMRPVGPVSTWTVGLIVMLFLSGVTTGACLSVGNLLDRLEAMTSGRVGPTVALGVIAIVSFPAACAIYGLIGLVQKGFNYTTTRLLMGVGGSTVVMALAATLSTAGISPMQVLIWGGNLVYIGSLCGWMVSDSFKRF